MRSYLVTAAFAATLIMTTLAGADAATRIPVRHMTPPTAARIVSEANAAFQRVSLARYNHDISGQQYDWLKSQAMAIKASAQHSAGQHGVLPPAKFVSLQARINRLDHQIARELA